MNYALSVMITALGAVLLFWGIVSWPQKPTPPSLESQLFATTTDRMFSIKDKTSGAEAYFIRLTQESQRTLNDGGVVTLRSLSNAPR